MSNDRQEQAPVAAPIAEGRPSRGRIPAPVVYTIAILLLVLLVIILLPKAISFRKDVETRFQESLVEVKGNHGDVLEVSTYKSSAYFSQSDKLDTTVLGIPVPLGTTEAFLMVPVTYRYHVLLSDRWQIRSTPETITVIAPEIRPSLPPAPDLSLMEIRSERGWARSNRKEIEDRVKSMVTGTLNIRAHKLARSQLIRDASRKSVESSLKNWLHWLPDECRDKVFTVRFWDEVNEGTGKTEVEPER
ncbi:MAG: hypothetical protein FJY85_21740 [Deltaproteobacteria bacterium]|nr:hypothetical protein [Deltaproteobacteria bacterium]MBM4149559.1 hypothetical protein [Lentisphaerota bacterium]